MTHQMVIGLLCVGATSLFIATASWLLDKHYYPDDGDGEEGK